MTSATATSQWQEVLCKASSTASRTPASSSVFVWATSGGGPCETADALKRSECDDACAMSWREATAMDGAAAARPCFTSCIAALRSRARADAPAQTHNQPGRLAPSNWMLPLKKLVSEHSANNWRQRLMIRGSAVDWYFSSKRQSNQYHIWHIAAKLKSVHPQLTWGLCHLHLLFNHCSWRRRSSSRHVLGPSCFGPPRWSHHLRPDPPPALLRVPVSIKCPNFASPLPQLRAPRRRLHKERSRSRPSTSGNDLFRTKQELCWRQPWLASPARPNRRPTKGSTGARRRRPRVSRIRRPRIVDQPSLRSVLLLPEEQTRHIRHRPPVALGGGGGGSDVRWRLVYVFVATTVAKEPANHQPRQVPLCYSWLSRSCPAASWGVERSHGKQALNAAPVEPQQQRKDRDLPVGEDAVNSVPDYMLLAIVVFGSFLRSSTNLLRCTSYWDERPHDWAVWRTGSPRTATAATPAAAAERMAGSGSSSTRMSDRSTCQCVRARACSHDCIGVRSRKWSDWSLGSDHSSTSIGTWQETPCRWASGHLCVPRPRKCYQCAERLLPYLRGLRCSACEWQACMLGFFAWVRNWLVSEHVSESRPWECNR